MNKGVIIVDFDNWFKKSISDYTDHEVEFEFKQLIEKIVSDQSDIEDIEIRLYGGWYKENIFTQKASELQLLLARVDLFPWINIERSRIIKGKVVLTSSINDIPSYEWFNTLKEKKGIASLRINNTELTDKCEHNRAICAPHILKKFTQKKRKICSVNECTGVHNNIFVRMEQKMVDTMIACDIISYCEDEDYIVILLVSEDIDHFPALAMGSSKLAQYNRKTNLTVAIKNMDIKDSYDQILSQFNLKTTLF